MNLLPRPKQVCYLDGYLRHCTVCVDTAGLDERLVKAFAKLPQSADGAVVEIQSLPGDQQAYTLEISVDRIVLQAGGPEGVFYAIQTLRQIFNHDPIPCVRIEDHPDFSYRGFYHDITRGRVPKVETLKRLIDEMAYYKMNSLQLYVEHTFPFRELEEIAQATGCLTPDEIRELDDYCWENFIEFIPSLATFGHLYELLQKPKYQHLCAIGPYEPRCHFWVERMRHHTIDPLHPESFPLIQSLLDQYIPLFRSNKVNICCDETFDLGTGIHQGKDTGALYVEFVNKTVRYLQSKGKTVMMWADILLKHPDSIHMLPEDIEYLNWNYGAEIPPASLQVFAERNKPQIVCPGTQSWATLCPDIALAESNISRMAQLGHQYGAIGLLNTNWGDYGHPCSLGMCMYPMVLGAVKSWTVSTAFDDAFEEDVDRLLFGHKGALQLLRRLSKQQIFEAWSTLTCCYSNSMFEEKLPVRVTNEQTLMDSQHGCREILDALLGEQWGCNRYLEEMAVAAEGMLVIAQLLSHMAGYAAKSTISIRDWLTRYQKLWREESKESELSAIVALFMFAENQMICK